MSSYQIPVKRNNEFSTIFNSLDYDVNASSKSNPVLFNDSRYLKSSGTNVSSNAITTSFNTLAISTVKSNVIDDAKVVIENVSIFCFVFKVDIAKVLKDVVIALEETEVPLLLNKVTFLLF